MKSKTKIKKQLKRKTNSELIEIILFANKNEKWKEVAEILSGPRRNMININLNEISEKTKEGDIVLVAGKVLSQGEVNKKIKIVALDFSEKAKDKLLKSNCEISSIEDEIKKNPNAKGFKILK